jgi:DNA gyrase subunit A
MSETPPQEPSEDIADASQDNPVVNEEVAADMPTQTAAARGGDGDDANPQIDINEEIGTSFLEYAMSVIVSRALPDVRDGLKPVQRRIIYSMFEEGMHFSSRHRKCANVIGNVMGKYHPHSNDAIYDALVRMGQDFSTRSPLIDPQGNFGTPNDPPAAMRYTECRLSSLARAMTDGINEDTVEFEPNYDGEHQQPSVLPARYPNLLVNGSTGIAVGMATNMPPHNLGEVVDAVLYALDHPDAQPEDFLDFIQGPDFPTGGLIVGKAGIRDALLTGRGSIKMRAVTTVEELPRGKNAIIVTELPYQVSTDRLLAKIALLVNEKKLVGISDLRDESSARRGIRIVIELKRDAIPQVVVNALFKQTQLQDTFGVNNVTLVDGVPRLLNVAEIIGYYVDHQMEVIERRTKFRLRKKKERAHIVEGLLIALDNIDAVIRIIRGSADVNVARTNLMERFNLSEIQTNHILQMPLRRLTALETDELRQEYAELMAEIAELEAILADPERRRAIIREEMTEIARKHQTDRRSVVVPDDGDFTLEDLIADDELFISISSNGYLKSVKANVYRSQSRGGRGVKAAELREDDIVVQLLHTSAHRHLLFFTNTGQVHRIKAHQIPIQSRTGKGVIAQAVLPLEADERIQAVIDTRDFKEAEYLVIATKKGVVKKTSFSEYDSRSQSVIAIRLQGNDEVVAVRATSGENDLLLFSKDGMGIRFPEADLRPMGRATQGVRGMKLRDEDEVVSAASNTDADEVLLVSSGGYGKRTKMEEFRNQHRGGFGVKAMKLTKVRGVLIGARAVNLDDEVFLISVKGVGIRTPVKSISRQRRDATGVKVQAVKEGLAAFAVVQPEEEEE